MNTIKTSLAALVLALIGANANAAYVLYEGAQVNYYIDASDPQGSQFEFFVAGNNLRIERKGDNPIVSATAFRYGNSGESFAIDHAEPGVPNIYAQTKSGKRFDTYDVTYSAFHQGLDAGSAFGSTDTSATFYVMGYDPETKFYDRSNEKYNTKNSFLQIASNGDGIYSDNDFINGLSYDQPPTSLITPTDSIVLRAQAGAHLSFTSTSPQGWMSVGIDSITFTPGLINPVPEPETYALMGMGLLGLIAARSRNKRKVV